MRSSRDRRIDRALSSVLDAIQRQHDELYHCRDWQEIGRLGERMDTRRIAAHVHAKALRVWWQSIVLARGD
jgi:hypothetical protein